MDPELAILIVFRGIGSLERAGELAAGDVLESTIVPGFRLALAAIFE